MRAIFSRLVFIAFLACVAGAPLLAAEVILDDASPSFVKTGIWNAGSATSGFYGTGYSFADVALTESASGTWSPTLPTAGTYDVYTWYVAGSNRPTNARYVLTRTGGTDVVLVNQTTNGSQWFKIGTYDFPVTGGAVRISNQATPTGKAVIADAVRLVSVAPVADPYGDRYQGTWIFGWGRSSDNPATGCLSASQTNQIVNNVRSYNHNAMFVQVRKVGDALYQSDTEPFFANADPSYTDPLADILAKAHDTSNGKQYMEVHAWLVPYRVWTPTAGASPPSGNVWAEHPEWRGQSNTGATNESGTLYLDPGVPEVTDYLVGVVTELMTRYPTLDGIHWDYFRYSSPSWGYNPTAIARFNALYNRTGAPATDDAQFADFRRDQIRQMGRKVYAAVKAIRWNCKVSAALITWTPSNADFTQTRPYYNVFQDWPSFMSEGLLDMAVPMSYFREANVTQASDFRGWANFLVSHKAGRHAINGPALYLNVIADSMTQINYSANLPGMDGTCGYVYHQTTSVPATESNSAFWTAALAQTHFNTKRNIPGADWITTPTQGILRGTVLDSVTGKKMDGATVTITGPTGATIKSDGTGFYAFLKVNPGTSYIVTVTAPGRRTLTQPCTILAGQVTTLDFTLEVPVSLSRFAID